MRYRWWQWALGIGPLIVFIGTGFIVRQSFFPSKKERFRCMFDSGDTLFYTFESRTHLQSHFSALDSSLPELAESDDHWRARWVWKVGRKTSKGFEIASVFSGIDRESTGTPWTFREQNQFEQPFYFRITKDCRIRQFAFDSGMPGDVQRQLEQWVREVEFVEAPNQFATKWKAQHRDGTGRYVALYRTVPGKKRTFQKQKAAYLQVESLGAIASPHVQIGTSRSDVVRDIEGKWAEQINVNEDLTIRLGTKTFLNVRTQVTLGTDPNRVLPNLLVHPSTNHPRWNLPKAHRVLAKESARTISSAPTPWDSFSGTDVWTRFTSLLTSGQRGSFGEAIHLLVRYFRNRPAEIDTFVELLRGGKLSKHGQAPFFLVLELAGIPEAEKALETVLFDSDFSRLNKIRAASALSDIPKPTDKTVSTLKQLLKDSESADYALLALGHMGERLVEGNPALANEISKEIAQQLDRAPDRERLIAAVDAARNRRDPELGEALHALSENSDSTTRKHAVKAIGVLERPDVEEWLLRWDEKERNISVREEIYDSFIRRSADLNQVLSSSAVQEVGQRLHQTLDKRLQRKMVRSIGLAMKSDPDSPGKKILVDLFRRKKSDPDVLMEIGKYVSAKDLP